MRDSEKKFCVLMGIAVRCAALISGWTMCPWPSMPRISAGNQALGPSTSSNGLALCSLHHKLFDRGAFSLSDGLQVQISQRVNGSGGLAEILLRFHGKNIAAPNLADARPAIEHVRWHRHEVFHAPVGEWSVPT